MSVLPDTAQVVDGRLRIAGVDAAELAAAHGTPLYVYCERTLRNRARAYVDGLATYPGQARAVFACKANPTVGVLRAVLSEGLGADTASAGELAFALAAGAKPETLIVHGNDKSDTDLERAIDARAELIVIDEPGEPERIERLCQVAGRRQRVMVRVTPGIAAGAHAKIVTGHAESKFGLPPAEALEVLERAAACEHLDAAGLHVHLGSQIDSLRPFLEAASSIADLVSEQVPEGVDVVDLGGGLAVAYRDGDPAPDPQTVVERIAGEVADLWTARGMRLPELVLEPGRSVVAQAGVTVYTVGSVKRANGVVHVAVDGGMSDNPRPALYGARYTAIVAGRADDPPDGSYSLVGKHCESGDVLIDDVGLPAPRRGDVVAVPVTGAYAASMASTYNALPRAAAVLVADGVVRPVVRRETVEDLLAREIG